MSFVFEIIYQIVTVSTKQNMFLNFNQVVTQPAFQCLIALVLIIKDQVSKDFYYFSQCRALLVSRNAEKNLKQWGNNSVCSQLCGLLSETCIVFHRNFRLRIGTELGNDSELQAIDRTKNSHMQCVRFFFSQFSSVFL